MDHLTSSASPALLHVTSDSGLTFEEEGDHSVGSWRFFRLILIGDIGWGHADTMWPNAVLQVCPRLLLAYNQYGSLCFV